MNCRALKCGQRSWTQTASLASDSICPIRAQTRSCESCSVFLSLWRNCQNTSEHFSIHERRHEIKRTGRSPIPCGRNFRLSVMRLKTLLLVLLYSKKLDHSATKKCFSRNTFLFDPLLIT